MKYYGIAYFSINFLIMCTVMCGEKMKDCFRNYDDAPQHIKDFYYHNHTNQTLEFVLTKKSEFYGLNKKEMTLWQAIEFLDTIKDESDPDLVDRPQSYHAYQSAEAARKDGHPEWFVLTAFIHDVGKVLMTFGQPQWACVGDTFPVGCKFSDAIIYPDYFKNNPDFSDSRYNTENGIYLPGCGFNALHMSWGHDEYLYHVLKNAKLPEEALYIIRYHSFYAAHREHAYTHFMNDYDRRMMPWLEKFNQYDLYTKTSSALDIASLKPYYHALIEKFVSEKLRW